MVDTLRVQWKGAAWSVEVADWVRSKWPTANYNEHFYDPKNPWQAMQWTDDSLGVMGLKSNRQGNFLWVERSIPKLMYGENKRLLSQEEAQEGIAALLGGVEAHFREWFPCPPRGLAEVKRLDVCYQQKTPSSAEVFAQLVPTLKLQRVTRHGVVLDPVDVHLMGIELHQSKLEHARWYDKGQESGDERYLDVVRQEEQLRRGKAGYLMDIPTDGSLPVLHLDRAREAMNRRYRKDASMEVFNLGRLLEDGKAGALAAFLVLGPGYETLVQRHISNGTFYRARNLARDAQAAKMTVNLTVPENAWRESMVL